MNNYERVQKSIDFMEENLTQPVSLEQIAQATFFSLPHFYRLFNALVGRTIKDYLRLRRLSEAAREVASTGRSILDIAIDYQFQSQESFARAFREAWGVNPSEVRKTGQCPELLPRIDLAQEYFARGDDDCLDPSIKVVRSLGPFRVAYCHAFGEDPEREAWGVLMDWAEKSALLSQDSPVRLFGFRSPELRQGSVQYGYEAWITLEASAGDSAGLLAASSRQADGAVRIKDFSGGMYAVTRASLPTAGAAWKNMYTWLRLSRYVLGRHQWLEEHLSPTGSPGSEMEIDLYLPLMDRTRRGKSIVSENQGNRWVQSVEVVNLEPMRVAYYRAVGTGPEDEAFKVMNEWAAKEGLMGRPGTRFFGFNNPNPSPGSPVYGYEVWVTVPGDVRGGGDVRVKDVPGGLYAVGTTAPLFHGHEIPIAWQEVGAWMRANKRAMGQHQWLEEHLNLEEQGATGFDGGLKMKLYCPLAE